MMISFSAGDVRGDPWPHVLLYPALPWDLYAALEYEFPSWETIVGKKPLRPNARYDRSAAEILDGDYPDIWKEFVREHVSSAMWEMLRSSFNLGHAGPVGIRRKDKCDIRMDCQIGVNTPAEEPSRVIGPHVDSPEEICAGLLYFPVDGDDAGGDLILYRHKGRPIFTGKSDVRKELCEEVMRVPYRANQAIFFTNSPYAVHGVSERKASEKPRRLVNFLVDNWCFNFGLPR